MGIAVCLWEVVIVVKRPRKSIEKGGSARLTVITGSVWGAIFIVEWSPKIDRKVMKREANRDSRYLLGGHFLTVAKLETHRE